MQKPHHPKPQCRPLPLQVFTVDWALATMGLPLPGMTRIAANPSAYGARANSCPCK
ncbi:hypothetical protein HZ993_00340 [Rhodoferax sp. AJA081-3]|uniref:hypothetical protein n=1 Tax=Rhodoferax sp. AJA081-3 TaxID=2752316 RepID=UPI001ADFBE71|nr:hypothetical protein [Rhodoferax sp. AJA081-3]QTN28345.1 hypothetical protein HZ993_00340 [Rhodoferax sp. AJA081-3]